MTTIRVAVPSGVLAERLRSALAEAFDLEFVAADAPCDAVIQVGDPKNQDPNRSSVTYEAVEGGGPTDASITLADDDLLDRPLRGQHLVERTDLTSVSLLPFDGETVLAACDGRPIWLGKEADEAIHYRAGLPLPYLRDTEVLRDAFSAGRFLALLPLVHFFRRLQRRHGWRTPPLRAALLVDDPNLHAPSYGYLKYDVVAEHAERHNYHVAIATIPLDSWYTSSTAARRFRERPDQLSLLVHGNNHVRHELGRPLSEGEHIRVVSQALRRSNRLQNAAGVPVSKVMAAPHGRCSESAATALRRTGYEALCISRPYPWLAKPPEDRLLAGWHPAEMVAGGLPVLPRRKLGVDRDELVLQAWLGQPLVVYCHQEDVAGGLEPFAEVAEFVNSLGDVHWRSLKEITRSSTATRITAGKIDIQAFTRHLEVDLPADVNRLLVTTPSIGGPVVPHRIRIDGEDFGAMKMARARMVSDELGYEAGGRIGIELISDDQIDAATAPAPPRRIWPVARRVLTESRDRSRSLVGR